MRQVKHIEVSVMLIEPQPPSHEAVITGQITEEDYHRELAEYMEAMNRGDRFVFSRLQVFPGEPWKNKSDGFETSYRSQTCNGNSPAMIQQAMAGMLDMIHHALIAINTKGLPEKGSDNAPDAKG